MKIKRPLSLDSPSYRYGVQIAASVASDYDHLSAHTHLVSECILGKLCAMKRRPKKNPAYAKLDAVLLRLERKVESLEGTIRFMARASNSKGRKR